ncbi:MAG: YdcF family protein [Nanoarchaeota archaeon]|nr:YdcF family protein [Nanoarchaeota archaeon]
MLETTCFNPDVLLTLGAGELGSIRRAIYTAYILKLDKKGINPKTPVILSGNVPIRIWGLQNTKGQTEAELMYEILTSKGIPPHQIYLDKDARNTSENLRNLKTVLKSRQILETEHPRVGVVDDLVHSYRTSELIEDILKDYQVKVYTVQFQMPGEGAKGIFRSLLCETGGAFCELMRKVQGRKSHESAFYNNERTGN